MYGFGVKAKGEKRRLATREDIRYLIIASGARSIGHKGGQMKYQESETRASIHTKSRMWLKHWKKATIEKESDGVTENE